MPAYWVARSKINDPIEYKKYTDRVPEIIAQFGGKVLARGGEYAILEGPEKFERFVVIEFPTMADAIASNGGRSSTVPTVVARSEAAGLGPVVRTANVLEAAADVASSSTESIRSNGWSRRWVTSPPRR